MHADKFKFKDPETWKKPESDFEMQDEDLGKIRVMIWKDLHFCKAAACSFWVARLERQESKETWRLPKLIWVAWIGEEPPEPDLWWKRILRRYTGDHWYRFAKQRLYWTLPKFSTPEQGERWSDLMPLITWELWLARPIGVDKPLPWQKTLTDMTPGRVAQGMGFIFPRIGTPTQMPKPRGNTPGWLKGRSRSPRSRFDVVKKSHSQSKKTVFAA